MVPLPDSSGAGAKNLHSVWDSVVYSQAGDFDLPFTDDKWDNISNIAKDLMDKHKIDADRANDLNITQWA